MHRASTYKQAQTRRRRLAADILDGKGDASENSSGEGLSNPALHNSNNIAVGSESIINFKALLDNIDVGGERSIDNAGRALDGVASEVGREFTAKD